MLIWFFSLVWASELTLYPLFLPKKTRRSDFLCSSFSEDLDLCFVHPEKNSIENTVPIYRIIKTDFQDNLSALQAYEYALDTVKHDIFDRFPQIYKSNSLPDMKGAYLSGIGETGLGCAAVLYPQALELVLRGTPMVAFPARDTCFIWRQENSKIEPQFHLQMAIATRMLYEKTDYPVTQVIYLWTGTEWLPWGEAVKKEEVLSTAPSEE